MHNFDYQSPASLNDALGYFAETDKKTRGLAGGTDLLVQLRANRFPVDRIVDLKSVPELNALEYDSEKGLRLGAAVPCWRIYGDAEVQRHYPGIVDAAAIIGGIQIQGRATFGGKLCNASPSGDTIPLMIALQATCVIASVNSSRAVPVEEFCQAPGKNILEPEEILVAIQVPPPSPNSGAHYLRFIPRNEMDIAIVGAGASVFLNNQGRTIQSARIALAAVAPTPLFAREAGDLLAGREVSDEVMEEAAEAARAIARPITDMRGTAEFRTHLVGVLTQRALKGAIARARGEHVPTAIEEPAHASG